VSSCSKYAGMAGVAKAPLRLLVCWAQQPCSTGSSRWPFLPLAPREEASPSRPSSASVTVVSETAVPFAFGFETLAETLAEGHFEGDA
jgi:hypothetical protein